MNILDFILIGIFAYMGILQLLVYIGELIDKIKKKSMERKSEKESAKMQALEIIDQSKEQENTEEMDEKTQEEPDNIQPITIEEHKDVVDDNDDLDYEGVKTMQEYCFIGCSTYSDETTEVWVELTDEEIELIEEYGKKASVFYEGFENCEELSEIYEKIYKVAVQQMTEEVREYGEDDNCEDPDWKITDTYPCWVDFPSEWEDELEDDEEEDED